MGLEAGRVRHDGGPMDTSRDQSTMGGVGEVEAETCKTCTMVT